MKKILKSAYMAKLKKSICLVLGLAISASFLLPNQAKAEGFALQDWSARGAALAGGLIARDGDPSSVVYNPAAITELEGLQIQVGSEFVVPTNTIETTDRNGKKESTTSEGTHFIIPNAYVAYKLNEDFSLGLGIFSRFGLGNEYNQDWPGAKNNYDVYLLTSTINPVVAWRVNDMLSLAAGLEISGAMVEQRTIIEHSYGIINNHLESEDIAWSFGFNLGAHVRFNEQWKLGLTYRYGMEFDFEGELTSSIGPLQLKQGGKTTMSLPHELKAAVAYYPRPNLSFEAVVGYYTWSSYKHLNLHFDDGSVKENPRHWNDTWYFSLSAEYDALDWLTLRAGVSYETSPVPEEYAEYSTPVNGRFKYSAGAGFHKNSWAVDLAYVYYDMNTQNYDKAASHNPNAGILPGSSTDVNAHSFIASFTYKF